MQGCLFPTPGLYLVELFCDGQWVADTSLELLKEEAIMNPNAINPLQQPETEFQGELQEFSARLLPRTIRALSRACAKAGRPT